MTCRLFCGSRKQFKQECQFILVPKSTQDSKDYGEIKLASDTYLGIPSQVCVLVVAGDTEYWCCGGSMLDATYLIRVGARARGESCFPFILYAS